ncbi:G patch domain-containing protein 8 isoform X2 [Empidonax traillii]|uniref:G patch domain-containing protein 8 isoform X2 n=1 Tax=Empidonax traillii TaxID=164674 RepID=UPI000FFDBA47|nr:G patch domain-containing protein 8 isoform X2 [Empidonax traillii]
MTKGHVPAFHEIRMGAQICSQSRGETGGLQAPCDNTAVEGQMSSKEDSPEPGTSAASTSQAPQDGSKGNPACPACRDIDTECSSSCRHCFCLLCLWDWSLSDAACPQCQRPTRHTYPQHVALYHEVQDQVYDSKQRRLGLSEQRARSCSGHSGWDGPPERGRRRSLTWHRGGRQWSRHGQGSGSSRRRRRQRRRNWDNAPNEGRAPRSEWDSPGSSWGRRSWHRSHTPRSRGQQEQPRGHRSRQRWRSGNREHSHGWDREWSRSRRRGRDTRTPSQGTESLDDSARQRHWRSRNADEGRAPRHQQDIPDSSGRSRYRGRTWSPAGHRTQ